jgi:hypothetical protein
MSGVTKRQSVECPEAEGCDAHGHRRSHLACSNGSCSRPLTATAAVTVAYYRANAAQRCWPDNESDCRQWSCLRLEIGPLSTNVQYERVLR